MGNVTLPTPVFVAGGALCLLAGYLVGAVAGPDTPDRATATVSSYNPGDRELCLRGGGVEDQSGAASAGTLCGTWQDNNATRRPERGDRFRFVSVVHTDAGSSKSTTMIYGDVVS